MARSDAPFIIDAFVSLSEGAIEEEVTRPIGWDRVKTVAQKEKGKEDSSSQSESSCLMCGTMFTLKKLDTSFTRAQLWKQYNKFCKTNTANMYIKELMSHRKALRLIKKDLNFAIQNAAEIQDEDDKQNIYVLYFKLVCIIILISMCHILN
jgi:hypothetical protein